MIKKPEIWSLNKFDNCKINKKWNRALVYLPNHHRANNAGYVYRSIAAYELYHPDEGKVTRKFHIHHLDHNSLNDSKENLEKLEPSVHAAYHSSLKTNYIKIKCKNCKKIFYKAPWIINSAKSQGSDTKYCSHKCYVNASTFKSKIRKKCVICGKSFLVKKYWKLRKTVTCSDRCNVLLGHIKRGHKIKIKIKYYGVKK